MKNSQKIKRVQLKNNSPDNFILIGLVSAEPDYKLSLAINRKFRISLRNISPVTVVDETGSEQIFSRFTYSSSSHDIFNLFSNRSGKNFLLKKLKNIDYLIQVYDPEIENNINNITASFREIDSINAVFNVDLKTFKDKNLKYLT